MPHVVNAVLGQEPRGCMFLAYMPTPARWQACRNCNAHARHPLKSLERLSMPVFRLSGISVSFFLVIILFSLMVEFNAIITNKVEM